MIGNPKYWDTLVCPRCNYTKVKHYHRSEGSAWRFRCPVCKTEFSVEKLSDLSSSDIDLLCQEHYPDLETPDHQEDTTKLPPSTHSDEYNT